MAFPNQIQDGTSEPFYNGQLVTPEILNGFVNYSTLKKGAISEQPVYDTEKQGLYTYGLGETLLIQYTLHGLLTGDKIKATFTSTSGGVGSQFDGYYDVSVVNSGSFNITVVASDSASAGTVLFNKIPSLDDEVIVHAVGDVNETKPKKITVNELLNSKTSVDAVFAEIGTLVGKSGKDLIISPEDGAIVADATYSSTNGSTVTVTKANHNLIPQVSVVVVTCTDSSDPAKGANYSGVFMVEAVTSTTFTYVLKQEQFTTLYEFQQNETDAPIVSTGTATYRRLGTIQNEGNIVVQGETFTNGIANVRDDLYVYGRARFGELVLPKGRTSARPATPEEGQLYYNKDGDLIEIWRKSEAFPTGSWETFDKLSNQIVLPAQYTQTSTKGDLIANSKGIWYSKTYWAYNTPIPFLQYEIKLPPIRLRHDNDTSNGTVVGKVELIASEYNNPSAVEYVIAGYYTDIPRPTPWGIGNDGMVTIAPWATILTPDDIDMSNKVITLRVSVKQDGTGVITDADNDNNNRICSFKGYVRITPVKRTGGVHIPTPWKSKQQTNSLTEILPLEREPMRFWTDNLAPFPDGAVCPIPLISLQPFSSSYSNNTGAFRPISPF